MCRRIKLVSVPAIHLHSLMPGVIQGICAECEQSQRKEKHRV